MIYTLEEIYASGGQLPVITLSITNEAIGTLRYVLGYEDMILEGKTYRKSAFTVSMPERSDSGFSDLSFGVDGVSGEAYEYMKEVIRSQASSFITVTQWHYADHSKLSEITLSITGGRITRESATFTASFCDMLNLEFPRLRYTATNAPGLNHYLFIRHTANGRKFPFLDCWGLVIEFYRRELGIELDDCTDFSIGDGYENVTSQNSFREIKAETAEFGDVLAFFRHGLIFHVGVYLGRGEMLHTGLNRHCRVEKVRTMQFVETRIYRHCLLLERKNET